MLFPLVKRKISALRKKKPRARMGSMFSSGKSREEIQMALAEAKQIVSSYPVVFSKTYCGYCQRVKQLFSQLQATYKVIELDQESEGDAIPATLAKWTGHRIVPNVFVGENHIGSSDETSAGEACSYAV